MRSEITAFDLCNLQKILLWTGKQSPWYDTVNVKMQDDMLVISNTNSKTGANCINFYKLELLFFPTLLKDELDIKNNVIRRNKYNV